jgi:anti-sigma factor RsiW
MTERDLTVTEEELHAFVDSELPADRIAAVERWLSAHPDDMARVAAWRMQADAIRSRYADIATTPTPPRFDLDRLARRDPPWKSIAAAAALVALLCGGAAGWVARGALAAGPASEAKLLTTDALDAYKLYVVEVRHPVEVPGHESAHLVQWLSKRLGWELRAPDLDTLGLKLVGGRLLPAATGPAGFLMYEASSGERYTIYCAKAKGRDTAMRYDNQGAVAAVTWVDRDVAYIVSGEGNRERLEKVAQVAYPQLETHGRGSIAP